jgi:poly(hydroxyalkanoate) depolymerase family esterase
MKPFAPMLSRWLRQATNSLRRALLRRANAPAPLHRFDSGTFVTTVGARPYKLFVPEGFTGEPLPLLVMLHGCKQDPDDFARGTRMNDLAQQQGFLVLYPRQPPRSNAAKCWNWFMPNDQRRGSGEPAVLAGMARDVVATHGADPDRVYVAGLSAGGAMAAILSREYPDVFAAAGVHSGLPQGAAADVASALAVMHTGRLRPFGPSRSGGPGVPTIVFHGDVDKTVHPANGQHVVDDVLAGTPPPAQITRGEHKGRLFTHTVFPGRDGRPFVEHWEVHGTGHAWSGGDPAGSYADPHGPDASKELLRFFGLQRRRTL